MANQDGTGFENIVRRWHDRGAPVDGPFWTMLEHSLKASLPVALFIIIAANWQN